MWLTDGLTPPRAALVLGYAGLLPPLACIAAELMFPPGRSGMFVPPLGFLAQAGAYLYAAVILSFIGGSWWGMAARDPTPARLAGWLAIAVVPSLIAVGAFGVLFVLPGKSGERGVIAGLCGGLLLALIVDSWLARAGLAPPWWMRLRVPLSCGLALETVVAGFLA